MKALLLALALANFCYLHSMQSTEKCNASLFEAIRFNNPLQVSKALLGAQVNCTDKTGYAFTPLHDAVLLTSPAICKILIDRGADVNAQNSTGVTPLMRAVMCRWRTVHRLLLEAGADAQLRTERGTMAIIYASEWGNEEAVNELLPLSIYAPTAEELNDSRARIFTTLLLLKRFNPLFTKDLRAHLISYLKKDVAYLVRTSKKLKKFPSVLSDVARKELLALTIEDFKQQLKTIGKEPLDPVQMDEFGNTYELGNGKGYLTPEILDGIYKQKIETLINEKF